MQRLTQAIFAILLLCGTVQAATPGRIAYTCDGNFHDTDDIGSSAIGLALMASQAQQKWMVDYVFDDHFPNTLLSREKSMQESCLGGASRFGFRSSVFFDAQHDIDSARGLGLLIDSATTTSRLTIPEAGPCEIIYRGFKASTNKAARPYITILSHSSWNDDHKHTGTHNLADLQRDFGPIPVKRIVDQNKELRTALSRWYWLRDSSNPNLRWVYSRIVAEQKPNIADVSDSGMIYFLLTGDQHGTPEKYKAMLGQ